MTKLEAKKILGREDVYARAINYKSICGVIFEDDKRLIININKILNNDLRYYFLLWSLALIKNKKISPGEEVFFGFDITEEDFEAAELYCKLGYDKQKIIDSELFTKKLKDKKLKDILSKGASNE